MTTCNAEVNKSLLLGRFFFLQGFSSGYFFFHLSSSRHVGSNGPLYGLPAEWAVLQGWGALYTADEVGAGQKNHADFVVHAHLASPLVLKPLVLLL